MTIECDGCGDEVAIKDAIFEEHMTSVMYVTETVPYCEEMWNSTGRYRTVLQVFVVLVVF